MASINQNMALIRAMANEYHNDRLKNTMTSGMRNKAVNKLVATRGLCLPSNDGSRAILKASTLTDKTMSCQLFINLL